MTDTLDFRSLAERAARAERPQFGTGSQIICDNLVKIYKIAELEVVALQGLDLLVAPGELIAIVGASGSGKSTLLNILGGLDVPSAGRAIVAGYDLLNMDQHERTRYRRQVIGFVWQQTARNLLPYLTAQENVELPMVYSAGRVVRDRARAALDRVGMGHRADHYPNELSGGEQQRVAIARALVLEPKLLIADEPTGNLDAANGDQILDLFTGLNRDGLTVLLVTHDPRVAARAHRVVSLADGRIVSDTPGPGAGKHTLKFSRSPKMSTYLVALLVGNFQCRQGSADGIPIRVCATPDKLPLTGFALEAAEYQLSFYNQYYGIRYPHEKLDVVALPDFAAGAMENFGAITFREVYLLADPRTATLAAKKARLRDPGAAHQRSKASKHTAAQAIECAYAAL